MLPTWIEREGNHTKLCTSWGGRISWFTRKRSCVAKSTVEAMLVETQRLSYLDKILWKRKYGVHDQIDTNSGW